MDALLQLGLGGSAIALLGWFLKALLGMGKPIIEKHIETMNGFQAGQARLADSIAAHAAGAEVHRQQNMQEHARITVILEGLVESVNKQNGGI